MSLPMKPGFVPRVWQAKAADAARFALYAPDGPGWQSGLVVAATGTGKGDFLAGVAVAHAKKGGRVVIVVDRKKLVRDLTKRCKEVAKAHGLVDRQGRPRVGVCMAERNELLNPIVVASIQTISQPDRLKALGAVSLLLTDEAHGATAPTHRALHAAIAENFPAWKHIGLTATAFRGDGSEGLGDVFDGEIFRYPIHDAIEAGDLVPIEDVGVDTEISVEDVPLNADGTDYNEDELAKRVNVPARNRLAWQKYLERAAGRPALFFAVNVEHANELARMGREEFGVNAQAVHGDNPGFPLKERDCDERIDRFMNPEKYPERERVPVLCSCDLIRVGFDAPHTYAVVNLRPTKSLVVFIQMVGRGTRLLDETAKAVAKVADPAEKRRIIAASRKPQMLFLQLVDAGCEMTLDVATNLDGAKDREEREVKPLEVGDEVNRRRHEEWGAGKILSIRKADPIGMLALVRWPESPSHPNGEEIEHALSDLKRARRKPPEVEPTAIKIEGHQEYRLHLLPGQRAEDPGVIGWYEYEGTYTVGAVADRIGRIKMHVRQGAKGWEVWSLRPPIASRNETGPDDIATCQRPDCKTREAAIAWGNAHIQAHAVVAPLDAPWKAGPASGGQKYVLRVECQIRRDLSGMSAGEADALIDAVKAFRRVNDVLNPGLANRRKWAQRQFRGGRKASA